MYDINANFAPTKISNLFSKITSVHSYSTRSSTSEHFLTNLTNHVWVLKSGMGYQLVLRTYPGIVLRKLLEQN